MKELATLAFSLFLMSTATAQDFPGYRTSNNTGVNGVFFNPANIADNRYRWDFTLFNVSTTIGNNRASFKIKDIGRTWDGDSLKNKIFSEGDGPSSGYVSAVVTGPSVFFNLGKKSALALTTRARVLSNIIDIDGKLAKQLINDANDNIGLPYTISSTNNMVVNANAWTEFGVSYARTIMDKGHHFLKGGISLKYLAGSANTSININGLKGTIALDAVRNDAYLTNSSGQIRLGFGGINISEFESDDWLSFESTGFGADIGFVYEYRPDTPDAGHNNLGELRRDMNKYKFRVGLSLLDVGSIKYDRDVSRSGGYRINIAANQRFYLSSLADIDDYRDTLNKYPQFFTPDGTASTASYSVALPTTLQADIDYHLKNGFYVNLATQLALTNSKTKVYNSQYYNSVTLTPRLEGRAIGVYVPMTYNALTQFTAGASFRVGPLFFGSGSILSAALGSSKQADAFIGFHFGGLQKK
ncbi:MAG TPA: DUF5723 family protein [Flavisolibacter sp.]|nr:DUF5723 family protein [Flavisolibacter sp.]